MKKNQPGKSAGKGGRGQKSTAASLVAKDTTTNRRSASSDCCNSAAAAPSASSRSLRRKISDDSRPDVVPAARQRASMCMRATCKASATDPHHANDWGDYDVSFLPNGSVLKVAMGPGCGRCTKTWRSSFEILMTLPECLTKCNQDPLFEQQFELASRKMKGDDMRSHFRSQVFLGKSWGVTVEVPMIGVTPAEFEERFEVSPSSLGFKQRSWHFDAR